MREILFRAIDEGTQEWVYGYYYESQKPSDFGGERRYYIFDDKTISKYNVIPETVGQYTGLTDKNGIKIFEGDIISIPFEYDSFTSEISTTCYENAEVYFDVERLGWWVRFFDDQEICLWEYTNEDIVVIGNIHDNPELIRD